MQKPRLATVSALATIALGLTAAAFPTQPAGAFSLDLSPLHRVSTAPTPQAGTYASAAPHGSHRHTPAAAHHRTL